MSDLVLTEQRDSVSIITMNRPERHNSLIPTFLQELLAAYRGISDEIRAVVLLANGRSFSTGGDVRGFYEQLDNLAKYASNIVGLLNELILTMLNLPVPIVTAVHGIVTGGSLGLILASDIVLVAPEASFTPYYSIVGFTPDGGWSTLLPQVIGKQRTAETILCNRTINAEEALKWGMATRIIAQEKIRQKAITTANVIVSMKPNSIKQTKRLLNSNHTTIAEQLELERQHFLQQIVTDEARQGIIDFVS